MPEGWAILSALENVSPSEPINALVVDHVCDELHALNSGLQKAVESALRQNGDHTCAEGIRSAYARSDEHLFNAYFAKSAYSPAVPSNPPHPLDGARTAIVFHMSHALQVHLVDYLRKIPSADVAGATKSCEPEVFQAVYRFTNLCELVSAIKSVQYDLEDFAFRAMHLLGCSPGASHSYRSEEWPFDSDVMIEPVLLGFSPSGEASVLNSNRMSSAVVASGLVRAYLDSVIFRTDFYSALAEAVRIPGERWRDAMKHHRDKGHVAPQLSNWVTCLYGVLSKALHSGFELSRGEVWAFVRVVDQLRKSLAAAEVTST